MVIYIYTSICQQSARIFNMPVFTCAAMFHSYILALRACSLASRLRGTTALPRLRSARATRTPTQITCADCPNEYLYQFGSRSGQPYGRQRWICSLSVYARLCTHTHAHARGRTCAHTHTHTNTHTHRTAVPCQSGAVLSVQDRYPSIALVCRC
jgi:hypothetical protein